ncbi:ABC transporter substrate-binding protein [Marinitenerispora sediminis]|uniref:Fe/B12 periplasmic-binding domain-containing protein n=1 Tax=Marinitenerispora sediminis TaxID=1931232 RepID=A0A368T077_9ACTN|nr:ABC transporter substrate-binding protein [Marinitenerispora sediminis]RCV49559.1 hypothetical protein DEF23_23440 [Marinitenerispora sediminis]RCV50457.1 hypothetical protein DEF28_18040 [Marinitenerispora sediminis]RCV52146.1 hypothetical protein DEF24_22375 [Marinitenerispora sediminis]
MDTTTRRVAVALGALPLLLTAACAPGGPPDAGPGEPAITVEHGLGTAELAAPPERVVTLSLGDTDLALALGVTPVAMEAFWGSDSGVAPWQEDALAGAAVTVLRPDADGAVPIEQVAAAEPDLILATGLYTVDEQYGRLSQIAPTVAYRNGPLRDTWQESATAAGAALGRAEEAGELVAALEARLADTAAGHPEFDGATFTFSQAHEPGALSVMRSTDDVTAVLLAELGLVMSEEAGELPGSEFSVRVGFEELEAIDADVALVNFYAEDLRDDLEGNTVFRRLPVVEGGGYIPLTNEEFAPLRAATVLSVPEALDVMVPKLEDAVG